MAALSSGNRWLDYEALMDATSACREVYSTCMSTPRNATAALLSRLQGWPQVRRGWLPAWCTFVLPASQRSAQVSSQGAYRFHDTVHVLQSSWQYYHEPSLGLASLQEPWTCASITVRFSTHSNSSINSPILKDIFAWRTNENLNNVASLCVSISEKTQALANVVPFY